MTTRMKSEERRAAIVRSAIHLFAEKGFRGTTTRELAAAAGITEPVLYQHFRAKGDDDRAFFRAIGVMILRRYQEDPELSRLLFFSSLERHELAELFFERL